MTRRWLPRLAVGALVLSLVTGCASNASDSGGGVAGAEDTFIVALNAEPPGLVRAFFPTQTTAYVGLAIQESLVATNRKGEPIPSLAESWTVSPDGLEYVFTMREGVTWHDGTPFSAEDVLFSLNEVLPLTANGAILQPLIEEIAGVGENQVKIRLTQPYAPLLLSLSPSDFNVIPKHLYEGTELRENPQNMEPIGTGPYKFVSWEADDIVLERNEDYWGGVPNYGKIVFRVIPDSNAANLALRSGEVDFVPQLSMESAIQLETDANLRVETGRSPARSQNLLFFNTLRPPLDNPDVRKALYQAIDRELIATNALRDRAQPPLSSFPQTSIFYSDDVSYLEMFPYDPEEAAEALDAAGLTAGSDGTRLSIGFRFTGGFAGNPEVAAVIGSNWRDIGVDVELLQDELVTWQEHVFKARDFDVMLVSYDSRLDPQLGVARAYVCEKREGVLNTNPGGYCNPELDAAFAAGASGTTVEERADAYAIAQELIARDLPTAGVSESLGSSEGIRKDIRGIDAFFSRGTFAEYDWVNLGAGD